MCTGESVSTNGAQDHANYQTIKTGLPTYQEACEGGKQPPVANLNDNSYEVRSINDKREDYIKGGHDSCLLFGVISGFIIGGVAGGIEFGIGASLAIGIGGACLGGFVGMPTGCLLGLAYFHCKQGGASKSALTPQQKLTV